MLKIGLHMEQDGCYIKGWLAYESFESLYLR